MTTISPSSDLESPKPRCSRTSSQHVLGLTAGFAGVGLLVNVSRFLLVFFYLPPDDAGLPSLVSDTTFLAVLNIVVLVVAAGRLLDAFTDPVIAMWSDRSRRRVPMMTIATVPAAVFSVLLFVTPRSEPSAINAAWLILVQTVMFIAVTAYLTPLFALIKDLAEGDERKRLSTITGAGWALGIIAAAMTPVFAGLIESIGFEALAAWRLSIALLGLSAGALMLIPHFTIDESERVRSPNQPSLRQSLGLVRQSKFLRPYLIADAAYWCGLMVVQTGLLYYVTILLGLDRSFTGLMILIMVVVSLPLVLGPVQRLSKTATKRLYMAAFAVSILDFSLIIFLGRLPGPAWLQATLVMIVLAAPFAVFTGVSNGLLGDIAEASCSTTGTDTTAMFFAARTFIQKVSQTAGLIIFAMLTTFGRDIGDDLGIRLSGVAGIIMYLLAAFAFRKFDEAGLRSTLTQTASAA